MTAIFQSLSLNAQYSGGHESCAAGGTSPQRAAAVRSETGVLLPPTEAQPELHCMIRGHVLIHSMSYRKQYSSLSMQINLMKKKSETEI